ncbi:MAG: (d)CMP kinase [Clostridia bacterium]|nr:(d)CMP kinase [Clostridia bacterium]
MKQTDKTTCTDNGIITVAIDGPASSGKSTVAKRVSALLNIIHVDTGAMYRAMGLKAVRCGIDPADEAAVVPMLDTTDVSIGFVDGAQHIFLDGEDVNALIRTEEVSQAASKISALPPVRDKLLDLQRDLAKKQSLIMDGRDICTVVLPDAKYKFYISASAEVRAERRFLEYSDKGTLGDLTIEDILQEIKQRDYRDMNREVAPLRPAEDAVFIDTSYMTVDEVVSAVLAELGMASLLHI